MYAYMNMQTLPHTQTLTHSYRDNIAREDSRMPIWH